MYGADRDAARPVGEHGGRLSVADLQGLADEQAALRRVAELVAVGASEPRVFDAVASEACRLLGGHFTALLRYGGAGPAVIMSLHGADAVKHVMHVGMRLAAEGDGVVQRVQRTAQSARVDNYTGIPGSNAATARGLALSSGVGAPIITEGRVWGAITVLGSGPPLADNAEARLEMFAKLVATAISNAQARTNLAALADEQAALRRIAELVARGAALEDVFPAVATEASKLLGDTGTALLRYDPGDVAIAVATCNRPAPHGSANPAQELGVGAGVGVPIAVEGRVWGSLRTSTPGPVLPVGTEERLAQFAELAAAAIAYAENKSKLTASRARVVATADETRRQLQRDLHDGAQQRLVHTLIALRRAKDALADGQPAAELVGEALDHAERATRELRDLVRGILPAALARGGLLTGVESLAGDISMPIEMHITDVRLPAHTETTAYFIVAEALTNVVKHAHATHATVEIGLKDHTLSIEVRDDGSGGADPALGTGLTGLLDRTEASGGTLTLTSSPDIGTTLYATLPLSDLEADPRPPGPPSISAA